MNESDTPETDGECYVNEGSCVTDDFARHLERQRNTLAAAIRATLDQNGHLADGEVCTLKGLKDALKAIGQPWAIGG